jgi:signal transduction histidine kinase
MSRHAVEPQAVTAPHAQWPLRPAALGVFFVAGYVALDWLSYIHPMQQYSITPWNPQPALAIGLLMLRGQRWLPAVIAAVVISEWAVRGAPGGWLSSLAIGAVLGLAYAAIAQALSGRFAVHASLASRRDAIRLVGVVCVGTLGAGVLYIAALLASGIGPLERPFTALFRFWIGDAVGILVTLPIVLTASKPDGRAALWAMLRKPEMLVYGTLTAIALAVVFLSPAAEQVKLFYVLFLPLILMATRFGMIGASVAALVIQGAVIGAGEIAGYQDLTVFEFQALLIALTITGLFLGVTVDERRKVESELRRTMRLAAAGEMAAALAHELNQPLTAAANYARASRSIAESSPRDGKLLLETLGKLVAECTRAADIVKRLRDFFRSGATRLVPVSSAAVVARAVDSVRRDAEAAQVDIRLSPGPEDTVLLADETQLEIVLRNLLANAIAATGSRPGGREIRITAGRDPGGWLKLSVHDTGAGVPAADLERIFEPFETSGATGMGMGLAISRAIVEAHGGRLWAEAGDGGIFHVALPGVQEEHA